MRTPAGNSVFQPRGTPNGLYSKRFRSSKIDRRNLPVRRVSRSVGDFSEIADSALNINQKSSHHAIRPDIPTRLRCSPELEMPRCGPTTPWSRSSATPLALGKTSLVYRRPRDAPEGLGAFREHDPEGIRLMAIPNVSPTGSWGSSRWAMLALLLPAILSLFHSLASSRTLAAIPGPDRPALAFDQFMVDFGEPSPRQIHEAQFRFENRSSRTVKIAEVKPSCGCLTPRIVGFNAEGRYEERTEFAPGEKGVLAMGIRPAKEQPGEKSYSVAVSYNDGQLRTERLEFRITLPKKKLTVEPNEIYFYQLNGESDSRIVTVRDFREKPAHVVSVEAVTAGRRADEKPLEGVSVTLGELTKGVDGEATWPIQVTIAPDLPNGNRQGWLVISTDDKDAPRVKIPLLLSCKSQATAGAQKPAPPVYGPVQQAASEPMDSTQK